MCNLLAQAQESRTTSLVIAVAALIAAVMLLGLIIMVFRKRLLARDNAADAGRSFMEDLRRMRDRGEISQEEFDATRRRIIERARQHAAPQPPPKGKGPASG